MVDVGLHFLLTSPVLRGPPVVEIVVRVFNIVADTLVLLLTWRATYYNLKSSRKNGAIVPFTHRLLRDGESITLSSAHPQLTACWWLHRNPTVWVCRMYLIEWQGVIQADTLRRMLLVLNIAVLVLWMENVRVRVGRRSSLGPLPLVFRRSWSARCSSTCQASTFYSTN